MSLGMDIIGKMIISAIHSPKRVGLEDDHDMPSLSHGAAILKSKIPI